MQEERLPVSTELSLNLTRRCTVLAVVFNNQVAVVTSEVASVRHSSGLGDLQVMNFLWLSRSSRRAAVQWGRE